ncbi:DUF7424 family protein [Paracandidimonas lactea]|uniref:DUF7424 family protein n=1 Tax=Paracandidimonas lactea TaxID=2895524 RepID=UPI001F2A6DD0|nr:hypothetical protein [Paracandidimonas lactea]
MRTGKFAAVLLSTLALAGCKATVETQVSLSELLSGPTKVLPGALYVEVASCADYQDSRKPSSSLVETQQQIPGIFQDAQFVECFRQKMDSYAHFKIPVYLDKDKEGKPASPAHINLISNESVLLSVVVPEQIQQRLDGAKKKMHATALDIRLGVSVKNDIGKDFKFDAMSAFVDGSPIVYSSMTSHKDRTFQVMLSDVSVQAALTGSGAGVLFHAPAGA